MASSTVPASHAHLLEQPLIAHLGTVRPDGSPQVSEMWFAWDGELARFTHTNQRQKFKNFEHEPRVAFSIADPDDPYTFLEVRGTVDSIVPDPNADFYVSLQEAYGLEIVAAMPTSGWSSPSAPPASWPSAAARPKPSRRPPRTDRAPVRASATSRASGVGRRASGVRR